MPENLSIRFDGPAEALTSDPRARQSLARALREAPGLWVLLGRTATRQAAGHHAFKLRHGDFGWKDFGPGFEAESHSMLGEHRVYARYVGTTASTGASKDSEHR